MENTSEIISVGQLNEAISSLISRAFDIVWVRGEISNFKSYPSGHWYFKLKDESSQINGVMFKGKNYGVDFSPKDGDQVEVAAQLGFYTARGDMQLTVQQMRKAGAGALFEAFVRLKNKLELAGLFSQDRKKPIPKHPKAIGIITSTQAAALKDVLSTLARRASHIPIVIYPSLVQGPEAAPGLIKAIELAQNDAQVDVILLVRGGGSIEDLWAFNDEQLAYAIAKSTIPMISGVGHETDFTIADFVADVRAPTPTAAAEIASPDRLELLRNLVDHKEWLQRILRNRLEREAQALDQLTLRLGYAIPNPEQMRQKQLHLLERLQKTWLDYLRQLHQQHDYFRLRLKRTIPDPSNLRQNQQHYQERIQRVFHDMMRRNRQSQEHLLMQLETLNPMRTLERGYSLILDGEEAMRDPAKLENKTYQVAMARGSAAIQISQVEILKEV